MSCPFFEPQTRRPETSARLPLLDEYRGMCHAASQPEPALDELNLRCCNHGYPRGICPRFPTSETRSSHRFDVLQSAPDALEILFVEERDYAPFQWRAIRFMRNGEALEPQIEDPCTRAQALAFSRSFLRRFGG